MLCERCHTADADTYVDMAHICLGCAEILKVDRAWVDNNPSYSAVLAQRDAVAKQRAVPRMQDQKPWQGHPGVTADVRPGSYNCACHERMGNDFYFLPVDSCLQGHCSRYDKPVVSADIEALRRQAVMRVREAGIFELPKRQRPASLNGFACDFHASNQRWWRDLVTGEKIDRNLGEQCMLMVSEIAEAMEGERKDLMDDHLPHRKMAEVELADAIIRIADTAGAYGYDIEHAGLDVGHVPDNKGEALLGICRLIVKFHYGVDNPAWLLGVAVREIESYAEKHGYDLWGAVFEKMEYNKHREDHKPAARLAANGKKF